MEYIYIGKLVNTHGLKGEVKILSNFRHKNLVYKSGFNLYVGKDKQKFEVESYRRHKNFDMVVFKNYYDINMVEHLKGSLVYANKEDLNDTKLALNLIGYEVICDKKALGVISEIIDNGANEILSLDTGIMIPYVDTFISNINHDSKRVIINYIKGLFD